MNNTYFSLSNNINKSKVFILNHRELEKRLDPFYYIPELLELEKKILAKNPKRLRDYVKSISSGATPKTTESYKYYSDSENGIPFLRVQNITEWGLNLSDVKFINKETHNITLKRSQIFENDLLVTITGRIASSAVAPKGFEGNINQHSVVIKTENKEISEILACYLNSSIGQKLAFRLTTGGTRPALDYSALLSIPVIYDKRILVITQKAVEQKKQNDTEAKKLLASINDYLLNELGINLPPPHNNNLKNRIFTTSIKDISGKRFDPFYHQKLFTEIEIAVHKSKFDSAYLKDLISFMESGSRPQGGVSNIEKGILSFGGEHVNIFYDVEVKKPKYIPVEFHKLNIVTETKLHDILIVKDGATTGKIGIISNPAYIGQNINEHIFLLRPILNLDTYYLLYYLNSFPFQSLLKKIITGATVTGITKDALKSLPIITPPLDKQKEIADHITNIRRQAQLLKDKTKTVIEEANRQIEEILLK